MTIENYNDLQYNENIESMEHRTKDQIDGKIKNPSLYEKL